MGIQKTAKYMKAKFIKETELIARDHIENGMIDELKSLMEMQERSKDHNAKCRIIYEIYSLELKKSGV